MKVTWVAHGFHKFHVSQKLKVSQNNLCFLFSSLFLC